MSGLKGREKRPPRPPSKSQSPDATSYVNMEKLSSLLLSAKALNRVASTPEFGSASQLSETASFLGGSERASSRGSMGSMREDLEELEHEDLLQDAMDELVDKLVDTKSRKMSSSLTRFYNTLATHNILRIAMTERIAWRIESALDRLASIFSKSKGARSGATLADGIRAAKCIVLIITCFYKSQIKQTVSGTCLESIATCCLSITPKVVQSGQNEKRLVSNGYIVWLSFLLLGLLIKYELISDALPEDSLIAVFGEVEDHRVPPQWSVWYQLQCQRILKKKEAQLKHTLQRNEVNELETLPWTQEDTITLDGLCLSLCIYLSSLPRSCLYSRNDKASHGFVWNFIARMAPILKQSPIEFINTYIASLPAEMTKSKSSSILLGVPQFLGLTYECWWIGNSSKRPEDIELEAYDEHLLRVVDMLGGKSNMEQKSLTKNLTKEVQKIFRDLSGTIDGGCELQTVIINIRKNDVTCIQSQIATTNPIVDKLSGETLQIDGWEDIMMLKVTREFSGNHSTLAFAMWMEETDRQDVYKGFSSEEKAEKSYRHAANRKHQKRERQNLAAIKQARNAMWED